MEQELVIKKISCLSLFNCILIALQFSETGAKQTISGKLMKMGVGY